MAKTNLRRNLLRKQVSWEFSPILDNKKRAVEIIVPDGIGCFCILRPYLLLGKVHKSVGFGRSHLGVPKDFNSIYILHLHKYHLQK